MLNSSAPEPEEMWEHIKTLNGRVSLLEHRSGYVSSAFPQNDLGKPDYDGHRKAHIDMIADAKVVAGYKQAMTSKVLGVIVTVVLTLLASGVVTFIAQHK